MRFFDKEGPVKMAMERAIGVLFPHDADVVFASIDNFNDVREFLEAGVPVIFYGAESEVSLRLDGHPAAPWFYSKNAAYHQIQFELFSMLISYTKIKKGEKVENKAAMLSAQFGYKQSLVGRLLHDIYLGKYGCEKGLKLAEKEFGFTGSIEEVRAALGKISNKSVGKAYEVIGGEMLPGVFCDVEGTLLPDDRKKVNEDLLRLLSLFSNQEKKPVTLWTGGDVRELEKVLRSFSVKYPVVSKEIFRGCRVETVYDDLSREDFEKQYGIYVETFNKIGNKERI